MAKTCAICGKTAVAGRKYKRRGMAVRKGGAGQKIVGKSQRRFTPNLQNVKIIIKGSVKKTSVCAKCIKGGKIEKA